jgi:fructokinase
MADITCFGEALIDFHAHLPSDPNAPRHFVEYAGGAPANVAVAVAKLGGDSAFVGMLGRDLFADFLLRSFKSAGVDTQYIARTDAANTALAFVSLDEAGERRFSFYRPPAADLLFRQKNFNAACFAPPATIFHAGSNTLTEAAIAETTLAGMQRARQAQMLVSFDINLRPRLWPQDADPQPRIWAALAASDLVKLCGAELAFLTAPLGGEQEVLNKLWQGQTKLVIVTDGAEPMRYFTRTHHGQIPAFRAQAINTTAAGDAFVGGVLYRLAQLGIGAADFDAFASDPERIAPVLRFGAACGAITVTRHGAFSAVPELAEVQALLQEQS